MIMYFYPMLEIYQNVYLDSTLVQTVKLSQWYLTFPVFLYNKLYSNTFNEL